jgi:hypothetical protein
MKHYVISLLIAGSSLVTSAMHAQSKVELGLRIMPQATAIRYDAGLGTQAEVLKVLTPKSFAPHYFRVRAAFGLGALYYPLKRLRLGADLLYSLQGGGYRQRKTNLGYFKLPLWIGFNSLPKRNVIFTIQTGIELSCLAFAKLKYQDGDKTSIGSSINRLSWGIPFAMGVKFKCFSTYYMTAQVYIATDFSTLSKTNHTFGAYNLIYPGIRLSIDQNLLNFRKK